MKASPIDVETAGIMQELCEAENRPFVFLLTQIHPRRASMTAGGREFLAERGTVLDVEITNLKRSRLCASMPGSLAVSGFATFALNAAQVGLAIDRDKPLFDGQPQCGHLGLGCLVLFWSRVAGQHGLGVALPKLWGGLGTNASGGAALRAERTKTSTDIADDRAALKRIERDQAALPAFTRTNAEAVAAARAAVASAERSRLAECGNGDLKQRGPHCRAREAAEQESAAGLGYQDCSCERRAYWSA